MELLLTKTQDIFMVVHAGAQMGYLSGFLGGMLTHTGIMH
jgi:hypothetical protein